MPKAQERGQFFVRKIAQTFVTLFIVNAISLLSGIITARVLGPSDKGIFTLVNLYPITLFTLLNLSIYRALTLHIAEGAIEFRRFPATLIAYGFLASAIMIGMFAIIFYSVPHYFVQGVPVWVIFTSLGMIPFVFIVQTFSSLLEARGYVTLVNFKDLFNSVVLLLTIAVGLVLLHARVPGASIAYVASHALTAFLVIWFVRRIDHGPWIIDATVLFRVIADGARLHIAVIASFILARIDMLILGYLKPSASLGYYSIAVSISELLLILTAAIQTTFYSEVSNMLLDRKAMVRRTLQIYRHSLILFILGACALALVSRMLITIFYGKVFLPALQPLLILLPGALALYLNSIFATFLVSNRRFIAVSLTCVISSVANIMLNFFLIPAFDFNGAAFASAVTYVFNAVVLLILFLRESGLSFKDFIRELKFTSEDFAFYREVVQRLITKIRR